jgi:endo-1,4-beta-xylanase
MTSSSKNYFFVALILTIALISGGCSKKSEPKPVPPPPTPTLLNTAPFFVGASLNYNLLNHDTSYLAVVVTQFNGYSTENGLTFDEIEPAENQFYFKKSDYMVTFSLTQHKRLHARNLIWHRLIPAWVRHFKGDSLAWESLFKTHIETEVGRYRGQVTSWDVVNEAVSDSAGILRNEDVTPGDGSIWRQHLGPDYIARAFQYAHEADPLALLFYNDYGQELDGVKLDSIVSLVSGLKKRGIPISGVGIQLHIDINTYQDGITAALQRLAATGLMVHISELEVSVNPDSNPNITFTNDLKDAQGAKYQFVVQTYIGTVPIAQRYGITTRGVGDADAWLKKVDKRKDWPLLFDRDYKKKPAYAAIMQGFKY